MKMAVSHDTTTTSKGDDRGLSSDPRNQAEGPGGNKLPKTPFTGTSLRGQDFWRSVIARSMSRPNPLTEKPSRSRA